MSKYNAVLLPFMALMEAELHANSGKGDRPGWLRMTKWQALGEIKHHYQKLDVAVAEGDPARIKEHAADVANCALMLLDVVGLLELDTERAYLFQTGPYEVELGPERWAKVHAVFERHNESARDDLFGCQESDLNGLVSEILIELDLARGD